MFRFLLVGIVLVLVLADCNCSDHGPTEPTNGKTPSPSDTSTAASIDPALVGTWHRTNPLTRNYMRVSASSITIGLTELKGVRDSNPLFAKVLVARNGQILFRSDPACSVCVNEYLYDYAFGAGDTVLYLAPEYTDARTNPTASTPDVVILRRDTISATTNLNQISDTLIGRWNLYDSAGTMLVQTDYLIVTADSIVYQGTVVFKGHSDPGGTTGRTLVARNGQVWYDYHWEDQHDMYRFDYAVAPDGVTLYWLQEETSSYSPPDRTTVNVKILKKR